MAIKQILLLTQNFNIAQLQIFLITLDLQSLCFKARLKDPEILEKRSRKYKSTQLNTCCVYTIQYPGSRVEEHWKGFKKSPITPVRGDGFMTNSRCPAAIEKVTHVAAEPLNVPYTLASNLNSVCALCVI